MDPHDCATARQHLERLRSRRRNSSPNDLREAAEALGYVLDPKRGKGSHWWMRQPGRPPFTIPTSRNPVTVGTTQNILRILQKVYDDVCA